MAAAAKQPPQTIGDTIQTVQSPPVARRSTQDENPLLTNQTPWEATNHMATRATGTHNLGTPRQMAPATPNPDATNMAPAPGIAMIPAQHHNHALNTPMRLQPGQPLQGTPTSNLPQGPAYGNMQQNLGLAFTPAATIPAQHQQHQGNQLQLPPFPYGNPGWQQQWPPGAQLNTAGYGMAHNRANINTLQQPAAQQLAQVVINPNMANLISGAILATMAGLQQTNNIGLGYPTQGGLTLGGKSIKLLNGANKFPVLAWCGCSFQDEVPIMQRILDSNEDILTKFNALDQRLKMAQKENYFVNYTLRTETVKDFIKHQFRFDPDEKNMMRGMSPFCLQKMEKTNEIALRQLEERMASTTYVSMADLIKRDNSMKFTPIRDSLGFITAISNAHALAWALFTENSPLTIGLHDLRDTVLAGHHDGKLHMVGLKKPDWFANALWGVYECFNDFFKMQLTEADLNDDAQLVNPLAAFNRDIAKFSTLESMGCPDSLLLEPPAHNTAPANSANNTKQSPKRPAGQHGQPGNEGPEYKRQRIQTPKQPGSFWKENGAYNDTLSDIKNNIRQVNRNTNLGLALRANSTNITATLTSLGIPLTTCG